MRYFAIALVVLASLSGFLAPPAFGQYKYNYKIGPEQYNYDVSGYGDTGYVYGDIDTDGKYVDGYLYDENGDERYFEGEFTDYGVIEGYDDLGNYYELEVD